jgi:hypothetical protein
MSGNSALRFASSAILCGAFGAIVACTAAVKEDRSSSVMESRGDAGASNVDAVGVPEPSDEPRDELGEIANIPAAIPDAGDAGREVDAAVVNDDQTVGLACMMNSQCEKGIGPVDKMCSNGVFAYGTASPTPVCMGKCKQRGDGNLETCDGDRGLCVTDSYTSAPEAVGFCHARCDFTSDRITRRCVGKNACNVSSWSVPTSPTEKTTGFGYCFGGCAVDADCTGGDKCSPIIHECVKKLAPPVKATGTACTGTNDTSCLCLAPASGGTGMCTVHCTTGATPQGTCGAGFICSARLPKTSPGGTPLFSGQPAGLFGLCLRGCAKDADCPIGICHDNDAAGPNCRLGSR